MRMNKNQRVAEQKALEEHKPPLFDNWNGMYVFVLVLHALVIAALYFLTLNYQ